MTWRAIRVAGALLALALMGGEAWRSWGADRPFVFVVDDFVFGLPLLAAALVARRPTARARALLAAGWAGNVGMLYGSFFKKVVDPAATDAGNWNADVLTGLVGLAFLVSVLGVAGTLLHPAARGERA